MKSIFKGLLIFAMLGIVSTGIGQTTSDLAENSQADSFDKIDLVTVEISAPVLVENSIVEIDGVNLEVKRYRSDDCEFVSFAEVKANKSSFAQLIQPPDKIDRTDIASSKITTKSRNRTSDQSTEIKPFRMARDGLNYSQR